MFETYSVGHLDIKITFLRKIVKEIFFLSPLSKKLNNYITVLMFNNVNYIYTEGIYRQTALEF